MKTLPAISKAACGIVSVLLASLLIMDAAFGQATATGQGITGSVIDPSGAPVPMAQVTVTNVATGIEFTSDTGDNGYFGFPGLVIGTYRVSVKKVGFETIVREGVTILAGQTPDLALQMKLGATTETVVVTGEGDTIDKTSTFTGETIPKEALQSLPIIANGGTRSPLDYISVFAGVSPNVYSAAGRGGNAGLQWSNIEGVGDGGGYSGLTSYKVDGVDQAPEQTQPFGGAFAFPKMPAPANIQEVRLITNTNADQGFNLGAVYEIITRSGVERYHGELYEYARNDAFDARNFLSATVPPQKQHDFGATFGGPIPGARKKHFFFVNYQAFRSAYSSQSSILSVPTSKMRQGDFSEILGPQIGLDDSGNPVRQGQIFDPMSTHPDGRGGLTRNAFVGNIIPAARLSKVSLFFQDSYPLPNLPGTQNNYAANALSKNTVQDKLYLKTDHNFGNRHRLSLAYEHFFRNGTAGTCGNVLEGPANYVGFGNDINNCSLATVQAKNFRLNYTFTIRPNLLLAFNTGVAYDPFGQSLSEEGLTAGARAGLRGTFTTGTPVVSIAQATGFGQQQNRYTGNEFIIPSDLSATWFKDNHQLKFGTQYNHVVFNPIAESFSNGSFGFDGAGTRQPNFTGGGPSTQPGYGWADYLLGWADSGSLQSPFAIRTASKQWAWYAMDQWRVTPKLTINYGLRWELYMPARETYDRWSNFCPNCVNTAAGGRPGAVEFLGKGPGRNGRRTFMNLYPWAIAPRLGIAYAITQSTVARFYYGISRYPLNVLQINGGYYPYNGFGVNISQSTTDGGITPVIANWDNGTFQIPPFPNLNPTIENNNGLPYYDYNGNRSHPQQAFGLTVEHRFSSGWTVAAKYAAKLMRGLPTNNLSTLNQLPVEHLSLGQLLLENINSPSARAANIPIPYAGFNGSVLQALRPYPQFQNINENNALIKNVNWHAGMFSVQQRFSNGLSLLANLTISRHTSNDPLTYFGQAGNSYGPSTQAITLRNSQMPIISFADIGGDRPVVANFTFSYGIPYGRGKQFGSGVNRWVDAALGGWIVSGILTYGSGTPEQISSTVGVATLRIWALRNKSVPIEGSANCSTFSPGDPNSRYLNPAAYSNPPAYTLGDTLIQTERRGCGIASESLSLAKSFALPGEGRSIAIGADASNVFNRHTWWFMNGSVGTAGFGRFGGVSPGRAIQLHARIIF